MTSPAGAFDWNGNLDLSASSLTLSGATTTGTLDAVHVSGTGAALTVSPGGTAAWTMTSVTADTSAAVSLRGASMSTGPVSLASSATMHVCNSGSGTLAAPSLTLAGGSTLTDECSNSGIVGTVMITDASLIKSRGVLSAASFQLSNAVATFAGVV